MSNQANEISALNNTVAELNKHVFLLQVQFKRHEDKIFKDVGES